MLRKRPKGRPVRCRTEGCCRDRLYVRPKHGTGVLLLNGAGEEVAEVAFLEVGQLRAALRDCVLEAAWPPADPDKGR